MARWHGTDDGQTARMLAPLFVAAFFAFAYNNVFMTLLPTFAVDRGATLAEGGLVNSVYLAVAVGLRFFVGPLADRVGTKPLMAGGLAAFVIGGALVPLCTGFAALVAVRCLQAVGLAAFWPTATATVADAATPERQGWWLGVYRFITSFSLLLGPVVAFALVDAFGFVACFGAMTACAVVALGCVGVLRQGGGKSEGARLGAVAKADGAGTGAGTGAGVPFPRGVVVAVVGATFVAAMGYGLLFSFTRSFVAAVDPLMNAGWYFTLLGIGSLVANPVAGTLADRLPQRRLLGAWLLCAGAGVALIAVLGTMETAADAVAFAVSGLALGFGYGGAMTTAQALAAAHTAPRHRATVLSLQQNAIDLGIAGASALFGAVFAALGAASVLPFLAQGAVMAIVGLALALVRGR
ncbi:MFS transporter [uncultured Adlercreutzia sp.]|uniref:MFS transporter n=1 Tax=uncultured Adlercreutzia sp. TaxID=875803 RepID=UPI0025D174F8|nr:MFS transporter [uncultured Adlercreutzia sp.]